MAWQVIQIKSAVQSGLVSLATNQASITAALSPAVDTTRIFLVFTRRGGTGISGDETLYEVNAQITNGTTLTFSRATQSGAANTGVDITWFAVRMTYGTTVQSGTTMPAGAQTRLTPLQ